MSGCVIYDEIFLKHNLEGHPENRNRLISIMSSLPKFNIPVEKPIRISKELLESIHDKKYISAVKSASLTGFEYLDPDTYVNNYSFDAAIMAAGACEEAVNLVANDKYCAVFCAVRPPGHHAEKDRAMGFCIFNNIVIAAKKALTSGFKKVFIVDFDAHHGNGTEHLIRDDENIFYFSTHQYPFYPGTGSEKENNNHIFNMPLPSETGDEVFIPIYERKLPKIVQNFSPDILLVSAGFDFHRDDPLTGLNVSYYGMERIVESVFSIARSLKIPIILTLEGGYNLDVLTKAGELIFKHLPDF
ncbi:histone deacetylase family protein [Desulfurobacterium indicum]|uniref:Histone deacetylase n=1 Tax=Desulfurobacterium indicum TaxID=1914305 RepID=A0A1R1MJX0_9BACT|nr:histone deacetylase [Desulfurobacterium indicum]OMH40000.1 histone deacetylase [Desulfurobacterium indicum]